MVGDDRRLRRRRRVSWSVLIGLLIVLISCFSRMQEKMVFYPDSIMAGTPADLGIPYESVGVMTRDGFRLEAWWAPHPEANRTILFFHGNAGNISDRLPLLGMFHRALKVSVMMVDYRGYGRSEGKPTEAGTYLDAEASLDYLIDQRGLGPGDIILYGRSLGGAIASQLASRREVGGLILDSTFTDIKKLAKQLMPFPLFDSWITLNYNNAHNLQSVRAPVLVIHSRGDDLIPFSHGEEIFAQAKEPKRFLEIDGDHNSGPLAKQEEYLRTLKEWLE